MLKQGEGDAVVACQFGGLAWQAVAMLSWLGTASKPAARISATTASAAALLPPLPSRAEPRSLTSTFAPRAASCKAWLRPRPPPAPVTMATRPSKRRPSCEAEEEMVLMGDLVGVTVGNESKGHIITQPDPHANPDSAHWNRNEKSGACRRRCLAVVRADRECLARFLDCPHRQNGDWT